MYMNVIRKRKSHDFFSYLKKSREMNIRDQSNDFLFYVIYLSEVSPI